MRMKNNIEIACLIAFLFIGAYVSYWIGSYAVSVIKGMGVLVLVRDIVGAYFGSFIIVELIVLLSWAYVCDRLDNK